MLQVLEGANATKRLRFTSAAFHHLSAIKIQRALRAHFALEKAKRQIHSVITIQVQTRTVAQRFFKTKFEDFQGSNRFIEEHNFFLKGFSHSFLF